VGLTLFAVLSYSSLRWNIQVYKVPSRYFWWSSIRLDSDPLNKHSKAPISCKQGAENCTDWEPEYIWIDPGWIHNALELLALPAFVAGLVIVKALGRLGVSQVLSFMISMPLLIFGWFYFVGWLFDRRRRQRFRLQAMPVGN
jgi:hypothetical protein